MSSTEDKQEKTDEEILLLMRRVVAGETKLLLRRVVAGETKRREVERDAERAGVTR